MFTYKTTTVGNGSMYGWNKYDDNGVVVESSQQHWNTEADAEKAIRSIASSGDSIEVHTIKNINPDANINVNLVKEPAKAADENAGMTVVTESIEDKAEPKGTNTPRQRAGLMQKLGKTQHERDLKTAAKKAK